MSSQLSFESTPGNPTPAAALDNDFRMIADELPIHIRRDAFAGQAFHLCSLMTSLELGRDISESGAPARHMYGLELTARYLGQCVQGDARRKSIPSRLVELKMQAVGTNVATVRFWKTYELGYDWTLLDIAPTTAEDFEACPVPSSIILFAANALRQAYQASDVPRLTTAR